MPLFNMDGWKLADLIISSIQLFTVAVLNYTHRLKYPGERLPLHIFVIFGIRCVLSLFLLICIALSPASKGKGILPNWTIDAVLCALQLFTSISEVNKSLPQTQTRLTLCGAVDLHHPP